MADPKGAFASVATREMPVLIEAWERNEIARAAGWARKHGLKGALRGAPLAGELAATLKQSGLGVILGPFGPGHPTRSLKGIVELSEQGVPLAFSLGNSGTDPSVARLGAAMAVGAGLDPVEAWKALSSDAARLAGVGRRVGRLERGMDADFVLWSGDPIDLRSKVQMVFIDGELVFGGDE
jgi:imidazolonepropionase-like amidohydrolase